MFRSVYSMKTPGRHLTHFAACIMLLFFSFAVAYGTNIVTCTVSDSTATASEKLEMTYRWLSNQDDRTRIVFDLKSSNTPFIIYKAEWVNCDSTIAPLEPFSLIARPDEVTGKTAEWHITLDFPFSTRFNDTDVLVLDSDKGIIRCPTSNEGKLKETINILRDDYEEQLDSSNRNTRRAWTILGIVTAALAVIGAGVFIAVRRRFIQKRKELEELSMLISERSERNHELEAKVDALYGSRMDTLNMLCNEYFEKNDSDKVKLSLYNEVEKHILALRDSKSIAELEELVNTYLDNIMVRVREQLPELGRNDMVFLTYLYAGFSPRAVCIFTDIKIKNFYNRRSRLKERILASDAPDREYFVSKM